jgi:carbon-monoxide dehydrogenase medium subunit
MFASDFEYFKASSVAQAIQLLNSHPGARVLAGGQSLIPLLKLRQARPPALVDIGGISELRGITVTNGTIRIGALTTHRAIESSAELGNACHVLTEVAGGIGDAQVRNWGTIGGNVAHADPASDWPTVLAALNARFVIQGAGGSTRRGTRSVAPADFFSGPLTTTLAENEILTAIEVPRLAANQRAEYAKMAHPASSFAVVGAAVVVTVDRGRCTAASVVVGGLVPAPLRATSVENALAGHQLTLESIAAAAARVSNDLGNNATGDAVYASADYRRAMAAVEIKHALNHAMGLAHH